MARRFDSWRLDRFERTPQGGIVCDAAPLRIGVLEYPWGREYRDEAETFSDSVMSGLKGLPLTRLHPPGDGKVTARTFRRLSVGHAGDSPRRDGDHVATRVYIQDAATVTAVERGELRELSLGYDCDIDPTPGVAPDGTRYDTRQTNVQPNHIALVPVARAGHTVALRLDSDGNAVIDAPAGAGGDGGDRLMKFTIRVDGQDYTVEADETAARVLPQALERERAAAAQALKEATARADKAEGERDAEKTRADSAEKTAKEAADPARLDAAVAARVDLVAKARKVLGADAKIEGSDREVMEQVIRAIRKDEAGLELGERPDEYVAAHFDALIATLPERRESSRDRARRAIETGRTDAADDNDELSEIEAHRLDRLEDMTTAWQRPLREAAGEGR